MKRLVWLALAVGLGLVRPEAVSGQQTENTGPDAIHVGVAYFNLDRSQNSTALELTYRTERWRLWRIGLQAGAMANLDGAIYGHGGLVLPIALPAGFGVSPSFSVGAYRKGSSVDLGSVLEFRSGIQVDRAIRGTNRIALFLYHLSNANLGTENPGTEVLGLGYVIHW
jgi:lipid A 3-O-deacylase